MSHAIIRTSPRGKGQKFVGKCHKCGMENLPMSAVTQDCPADALVSDERAFDPYKSFDHHIKAQEAEITRLRAELATARRDGMEEAAQIAAEFEIVAHLHGPWSDVPDECAVQASREIAAAIRAAAGEGK